MVLLTLVAGLLCLSVCPAVELDKSLLYGHNVNLFEDNDANNHYATCMVRTQGFDMLKNLTELPSEILTNFICNAVEKPTLDTARHVIIRRGVRETDKITELKAKFGNDAIDKLNTTLHNFFNEDVEKFYDTLIGYKSRFYYAEIKVLKDVLGELSVQDVDNVIEAIKHLRDMKSLFSRLVGFEHTNNMGITNVGKKLMCDLVNKLPKAGAKSMCSYWSLVSLLGEPCGPAFTTTG